MRDFFEKFLLEIKGKISKKEYYILLIVFIIIELELKTSLIGKILKASWFNIFFSWVGLIFLLIFIIINILLINKSDKIAFQNYANSKNDYEYNIKTKEINLTIVNKYFYYSKNQEIILQNLTGNLIESIKGHIDFYIKDLRVESKDFFINDLPKDKSHLICALNDLDVIDNWNYATISYKLFLESNEIITNYEKGSQIIRLYNIKDLLNTGKDLRWYKNKIKRPFIIIKFYWQRNYFGKSSFIKELKLVFRKILIILLSITTFTIILFIIINVMCFIWNFIEINLLYIIGLLK